MTMSMLLRMGTVVCQYSTHLETLSPHLAGGAVEKENWVTHVGSPLTRMGSCMSVTVRTIAFKYFEHIHTWSTWQQFMLFVLLVDNQHIHASCVYSGYFVLLCSYSTIFLIMSTLFLQCWLYLLLPLLIGNHLINTYPWHCGALSIPVIHYITAN